LLQALGLPLHSTADLLLHTKLLGLYSQHLPLLLLPLMPLMRLPLPLLLLLLLLLVVVSQVQDVTWPPLRQADFDVSLGWVLLLLAVLLWTQS
jgi:hypothetical protein